MEYPELIEQYELTEENICQQISDAHLSDISQSCCKKWRLLPAHLAMKAISVSDIEQEHRSEEDRRQAFFTLWKNRKGAAATYKALITALIRIDYRQDVDFVCKLLKESHSDTTSIKQTENSDSKVATTVAHTPDISIKPDDDTLEDLKQQLEDNIRQIINRYALFVSAIRKHIKKKGVSASELCAHLMSLPAFSSDEGEKKLKLLSEAREELEKADSVDKIFIILSDKYASFLDFEVFLSLLDEYGTNERIEELDYPTHLKDYVKRHKIKEFIKINPLIKKITKFSTEVVLKIDIKSTCKLAKLTNLKKSLCKILGLRTAALQIIDVKKGCVQLTLLMPAHLADFIFTSDKIFTPKQIQQFKALSVEWLKCNGQTFYVAKIPNLTKTRVPSSKLEDTAFPGTPAPPQDIVSPDTPVTSQDTASPGTPATPQDTVSPDTLTLSPNPEISPNPSEDEVSSAPLPPLSPTVQLTLSAHPETTQDPSDKDSLTAPLPATPRSTPSPLGLGDGEIIPAPLTPPSIPQSPRTSRPWSPTARSPLPLNPTPIPPRGCVDSNSASIPTGKNITQLATKDTITIVLVGKSGAGKSTLAKNVFGINFDTKMSAFLRTKNIQEGSVTKNNITLKIVDTVGLEGTKAKNQLKQISKHVSGEADLLLYCLPIGPGSRFEDHNPEIMKSLQDAFGKDIWQHCMVVLTFSNLAWNHIKGSHRNHEEAVTMYKEHIQDYAAMFEKELRKLKVKNPNIKTVFDLNPRIQDNDNCFLCVPVGLQHNDSVLAGNHYRIVKIATDFLPESFSASAREEEEEEYAWEKYSEDNWAAVLVFLILQRCPPECSTALLQHWYGRQRIGTALKQTGVPIALGGGSATGGAVGGTVGAVVGGVLGAPGGAVGIPIGITVGFSLGMVIGTVVGGGGAVGVTGAVGHALDRKKKAKKNNQRQEEQDKTQEQDSGIRNSIIL